MRVIVTYSKSLYFVGCIRLAMHIYIIIVDKKQLE